MHATHGGVANAIGAASAMISGEVDHVVSKVERALADAEGGARDRALSAGANAATIKVVDVEDVPLASLPGNARRVRVRVVGEIAGRTPGLKAAE